MKEIKEEVKTYNIYYEAVDGTRFYSKEECEKYENTVRCVLKSKIERLTVSRQNGWELLRAEGDIDILALKIECQDDVDDVLKMYYLDHPIKDDESECAKIMRKEIEDMVYKAYKDADLLLVCYNFDEELCILDTRNEIVKRLKELGK